MNLLFYGVYVLLWENATARQWCTLSFLNKNNLGALTQVHAEIGYNKTLRKKFLNMVVTIPEWHFPSRSEDDEEATQRAVVLADNVNMYTHTLGSPKGQEILEQELNKRGGEYLERNT